MTTTAPTSAPARSGRFSAVTVVAVLAALGVGAGGLYHYGVWKDRYKGDLLPDDYPGAWVVKKGFPINAAVSILLALVILAFAFGAIQVLGRFAVLAALGVQAGSIVAIVLSRQASIFGWKETGWDTDAKKILVIEIVSAILLLITLLLDLRRVGLPTDEASNAQ
jgi:hypothetical protein